MWTAAQRAVVIVICAGLLLYLSIRLAHQHTFIADPQPPEGLRASELAERLDPNAAKTSEIAAIPNVGQKLADAIVGYRQNRLKERPGEPVFREAKDLLRVRGIGAAKMEAMEGYLIFPSSTSRPRKP